MNVSNFLILSVFQLVLLVFSTLLIFLVRLPNKVTSINLLVSDPTHSFIIVVYLYQLWLFPIIANRNDAVEPNPLSRPVSCEGFSICYCHLNSVSVLKFIKTSLLRAYISVKKFDIICLSEIYLDVLSDDGNSVIERYSMHTSIEINF